jgi:hypothetical protein
MQAGVAAVIGALRVVLGADTPIVEPGLELPLPSHPPPRSRVRHHAF